MKNPGKTAGGLILVALVVAGCNRGVTLRPSAINGTKYYAVSADAAAFYRFGPQQGNGPDATLPRNTLVTLIRPSFGYSKVQLVENHQQGYVASEDIRVAPASVVEAAKTTPPPVAATSKPPGEQFKLDSNDPRLAAPPEQLPAPDLPPATDVPPPEASPQDH